jgi:hypothetical protein
VSPKKQYVYISYGVVVVGTVIALFIRPHVSVPKIEINEGFTALAVIYIVAQAIERLMQPLTELTPGAKEKAEAKKELRAGNDVEGNKTKVLQIEADRAVCFWAVATILALAACTILGLGLIQSIASINGGNEVSSLFKATDLVLTAVAIGAGTKPLHDLIGSIQQANQKNDPATGGN